MYFEIENTPEHIRKARRAEPAQKKIQKEECPRLILAPFSKSPQVVFDNVMIGTSCEKTLEVFNPSKQEQQITLGRSLPEGLIIHLPGEWLVLEPETCYCLTLLWSPIQPTATRDTIRFTNENRGRYDVILVLKTGMTVKEKGNQPKGFKISPGKVKKKPTKKSPVSIYKKKAEVIYNTTKIKNNVKVAQTAPHRVLQPSNRDNMLSITDNSFNPYVEKCPFDSPSSVDFNFDTSEIFSNMRRLKSENFLQDTYDKLTGLSQSQNVLKDSFNKPACNLSGSDLFDNIRFTPLKSVPNKTDKLDKGPQIIVSMNSESDFDDSLNMKTSNKENETHSIISITATQPPNKWLTINHHTQLDRNCIETPSVPNKKIPNTSSPKELNSPNFSINTEFSRISDLSFFPQRFSTERKGLPRINNDTHDLIDEISIKAGSDTYTKDSPNTPVDFQMYTVESKPPNYFLKDQHPKMCRQSLFKEYHMLKELGDRNFLNIDSGNWQTDHKNDIKSPSRSTTPPPLQSIPEESTQFSETQILDKTDKQMSTFTINRTFDRDYGKSSLSANNRPSWSKKAVRADLELWKMPTAVAKKSLKPKTSIKGKASLGGNISNTTFEANKSISQNKTITNHIGNVYSQSSTVDPFLSTTYFYDEEAVFKFEKKFKRWLNCVLTPPADLDSNIEQKIDVGKAWLENRNKEVPLAPTKEQVCNNYHNSHRLESLRRSARTLLMTQEIAQVSQKLNVQIEKKLISIRTDKNLHLDIGLQKVIMEILLSYNPLWLRIGLEAIYGITLPLKTNSDIEGLTTFIIQRMFKNPFLKNKHSKSNAPNMLLPAYMEAIKKFTLKKFFMLVFFLDQAKQRKLISHDPCLFCRNAVCKESREVIIRFTRELIAGIGDITRHLRPLGYVVSHKQSYLDEYKYAVHNIAVDLRDGVRLTKVMEIILMKNGLLHQLRTPAISRLQKIHNMNVALNALKEANFVIVGDISAQDIADGHREKTLSLLWQLIHVFRAPLFEKAASVIQTWWKKKYEVIVEKRREEEKLLLKLYNSASVIQRWWRAIQYNRLVEWQMQQVTNATIVIQKFCRMWLCRSEYRKMKYSILKIEAWYKSKKMIKEAKEILERLKQEKEILRQKSATIIQSYVRRYLCMKQYKLTLLKIVLVQSLIRTFLVRKQYLLMIKYSVFIQQKYKSKLLMRSEIKCLAEKKKNIIVIQSWYRMVEEQRYYQKLKMAVIITQQRFRATALMKRERENFLRLKSCAILLQSYYRCKKMRTEYTKQRSCIIQLQRRIRAHQLMKKERQNYLFIKQTTVTIQTIIKSYLVMKKCRNHYLKQRRAVITIQNYFRAYLLGKSQRKRYIRLRSAAVVIQTRYRSLVLMRKEKIDFLRKKNAVLCIQRKYRAQILMKQCLNEYQSFRRSAVVIQQKYKAYKEMRKQRSLYLQLKSACVNVQAIYRAKLAGNQQRKYYLRQKEAAIKIQTWFRSCNKGKKVKEQYERCKKATLNIQRTFRAYVIGRKQRLEYIQIRTATISIQKYYQSYIEMKTVRQQYIQLKTATITIQKFYKSHLEMKKQRAAYLEVKRAVLLIQQYFKQYRETKKIRETYCELRKATIFIQNKYRSICTMRSERSLYLELRNAVLTVQQKYKALIAMRRERELYTKLQQSVVIIQRRFRANVLMRQEKIRYTSYVKSCIIIQQFYRAHITGKRQRNEYLRFRNSALFIQKRYRAMVLMRKERASYLMLRQSVLTVQSTYRACCLMRKERSKYLAVLNATTVIQKRYRAYILGKIQKNRYIQMKSAAITIQKRYRYIIETRNIRKEFIRLKHAVVNIQRTFRHNKSLKEKRRCEAARKIQAWFKSVRLGHDTRQSFLLIKENVTKIQSTFRMHIQRKKYVALRQATITLQRYYRSYRLTVSTKRDYVKKRIYIIKVQSYIRTYIARKNYLKIKTAVLIVQAVYRFKKHKDQINAKKEIAAISIQKNVRRYLAQTQFQRLRNKVIFIQKLWKGKLVTGLMHCEFLQKRNIIIRLQSIIRGYQKRKEFQIKKENILRLREEKRQYWAASKIQALFRGHKVRVCINGDKRVAELRRRWREGALKSTQESLKERNDEAMEVLRNMSDIETVIRAFRSLELLTEVFPMMYHDNASSIVRRVYIYMLVTNRSISSIEVLKSAASVLVNLSRYRITGPKIYARDRIPPILKFMWRFSNSETHLFCILSTYIWLFSKYDDVREDLTEYLHMPENHRILTTIKSNVDRMKRMASNATRGKFHTPQPMRYVSHMANQSLNRTSCSNNNSSILLPALEPDYGIVRADKPRYFEDAQQAINCLFLTYNL